MPDYLLIESRDPFDSGDVKHYYDLAAGLAGAGGKVTLFLVQNGVLPARRCAASGALSDLAGAGVEILADEFSLRERGIDASGLATGVRPAPLDIVIDHLEAGRKALWH